MKKKKTYRKPEISRVELEPEDAVLTACKTAGYARIGNKCRTDAVRCNTSKQGS